MLVQLNLSAIPRRLCVDTPEVWLLSDGLVNGYARPHLNMREAHSLGQSLINYKTKCNTVHCLSNECLCFQETVLTQYHCSYYAATDDFAVLMHRGCPWIECPLSKDSPHVN